MYFETVVHISALLLPSSRIFVLKLLSWVWFNYRDVHYCSLKFFKNFKIILENIKQKRVNLPTNGQTEASKGCAFPAQTNLDKLWKYAELNKQHFTIMRRLTKAECVENVCYGSYLNNRTAPLQVMFRRSDMICLWSRKLQYGQDRSSFWILRILLPALCLSSL